MPNQLWNYWHAEAERLEKEVRELKAKLDEAKERFESTLMELKDHNNKLFAVNLELRAEVERLKKLTRFPELEEMKSVLVTSTERDCDRTEEK